MSSRAIRLRILVIFIVFSVAILAWKRGSQWIDSPHPYSSQTSPFSTSTSSNADEPPTDYPKEVNYQAQQTLSSAIPELPPAYKQHEEPLSFCNDRFGIPFLEHLNESAASYCQGDSQARGICFHVDTAGGRTDYLCMAGPVTYDQVNAKYLLPCIQEQGKSFGSLGRYWYDTGPGIVFRDFVDLTSSSSDLSSASVTTSSELMLLVKREGSNNLWHSLMEIFAATMTLDVISMARNPETSAPLLAEESYLSRVRVVILDSHEDGPFWDMWSHLSPLPLTRLRDLNPELIAGSQIVVPLAGGANPFWQGDWEVLSCGESVLLDVFVRRIFESYGLSIERKPEAAGPIRLTYIDRREKRKLFDQDAHIEALRGRFPEVIIEVVDFANMTVLEQIQKARHTDVLVGVHGAGLTHSIFMDRDTAVVEIMPEKLDHKGFRNLAKLRGMQYFGAHGTEVSPGDDWHQADVMLNLDEYLHLIDAAIASVSNSGLRNNDIH